MIVFGSLASLFASVLTLFLQDQIAFISTDVAVCRAQAFPNMKVHYVKLAKRKPARTIIVM